MVICTGKWKQRFLTVSLEVRQELGSTGLSSSLWNSSSSLVAHIGWSCLRAQTCSTVHITAVSDLGHKLSALRCFTKPSCVLNQCKFSCYVVANFPLVKAVVSSERSHSLPSHEKCNTGRNTFGIKAQQWSMSRKINSNLTVLWILKTRLPWDRIFIYGYIYAYK